MAYKVCGADARKLVLVTVAEGKQLISRKEIDVSRAGAGYAPLSSSGATVFLQSNWWHASSVKGRAPDDIYLRPPLNIDMTLLAQKRIFGPPLWDEMTTSNVWNCRC